jgi:uncharacterized paraquat-inducible protein A
MAKMAMLRQERRRTIMADDELDDKDDKDQEPQEQDVREESQPRRCPHCKATVADDADICPRCNRDLTQPTGKRLFSVIVLLVIVALVIVAIWASFFGPREGASNNAAPRATTRPAG